jgi:hypothetical protein
MEAGWCAVAVGLHPVHQREFLGDFTQNAFRQVAALASSHRPA